jgi:hypothetical protein
MTLTKIAGIVGAASVIIGAIFTIDNRYVHADELKKQMLTVKDDIASLRRSRLEDEVFKIELIHPQKRTDADKALLDRYKRQIKEIDASRWREHER